MGLWRSGSASPRSGIWIVLSLLICSSVQAAITIRVPEDVPTIPQAVSVSSNGDTILVGPGTHTGSVHEVSRTLTIEARSPEQTTWVGTDSYVLRVDESADITLRGFTIRGGGDAGLGCFITGRLTVEDCTLRNNGRIGAHVAGGSELIVRRCLMFDNPPGGTTLSHGGVRTDNSNTQLLVENCVIFGDRVGGTAGYGMLILSGTQATVRDTVIVGPTRSIDIGGSGTSAVVTGCRFSDCNVGVRGDRSSRVNAGDLGNASADDDGGNVFLPDVSLFYLEDEGASSFIGEGNIYPRRDEGFIRSRINGDIDFSPALAVVIDRVSANPSQVLFETPIPDAQWIELRAVSDVPVNTQVDVGGWMIADDPSFGADEGVFTVPGGTILDVGESLLLPNRLSTLETVFRTVAGAPIIELSGGSIPFLDPVGDELFLSPDPAAGIMDALLYGAEDDTTDFTVWLSSRAPASPAGRTLARTVGSPDTNTAFDWSLSELEGRVVFRPREALILE